MGHPFASYTILYATQLLSIFQGGSFGDAAVALMRREKKANFYHFVHERMREWLKGFFPDFHKNSLFSTLVFFLPLQSSCVGYARERSSFNVHGSVTLKGRANLARSPTVFLPKPEAFLQTESMQLRKSSEKYFGGIELY